MRVDDYLESCPLGTIFSMLMDLADCSTIEQCEELFTFVETKMSKWKAVSWLVLSHECTNS